MRLSSIRTRAGGTIAIRKSDGLYDLRAADSTLPDGIGPLLTAGRGHLARAMASR